MVTLAVGDSIAVGLGTTSLVANRSSGANNANNELARGGIAIPAMQPYFERAIGRAQSGDTIIVSAGYNYQAGPIPADHLQQLTGWINQLKEKGANVVLLGLRETGLNNTGVNGNYERLYGGTTPERNNQLRALARSTGTTFSEESVNVANTIPRGEIHGQYTGLATAALRAVPGGSSGASTARPAASTSADAAGTGTGTGSSTGTGTATGTDNSASRDADRAASASSGSSIGTWLMENIIQPIIDFFSRMLGIGSSTAQTGTGSQTGGTGQTAQSSDPDRARAQASGVDRRGVTGGTETAEVGPGFLPPARGPLVRAVG